MQTTRIDRDNASFRGVVVPTSTGGEAIYTTTEGDGIQMGSKGGSSGSGGFSVGDTPDEVTARTDSTRMHEPGEASLEAAPHRLQFPIGEDMREDLPHPPHHVDAYPGFPETTRPPTTRGRPMEDRVDSEGFVRRTWWNGGTNR
jgi:hypothetical protein